MNVPLVNINQMVESIRQNLPATVGTVLQDRLAQADSLQEALETSRNLNAKLREQIKNQEGEIRTLNSNLMSQGIIEDRERSVTARENVQRFADLERENQAQKLVAESAWSFISNLSKSGFKETMYKGINTMTEYNNGVNTRYVTGESTTREVEPK